MPVTSRQGNAQNSHKPTIGDDMSGVYGWTIYRQMVSEMSRNSAAYTLRKISRDMVSVYYTYSFSARSSVASTGGAP